MERNTVKNAILRTAAALAYDMVVGMFGVEAVACIRMLDADCPHPLELDRLCEILESAASRQTAAEIREGFLLEAAEMF